MSDAPQAGAPTPEPTSFHDTVQQALQEGANNVQTEIDANQPPADASDASSAAPAGPSAATDPPAGVDTAPDHPEPPEGHAEGDHDSGLEVVDGKFFKVVGGSSLDDLLSGDAKIQFRANGEDHELSLEKALTWAQQMRSATTSEKRLREQLADYKQTTAERDTYKTAAEANDKLLKTLLRGGTEADNLLRDMRRQYREALDGAPAAPEPPASPEPTTDQREAAGLQLMTDMVKPWADTLGEAFGAPGEEVAQEILVMIGEEPNLDWDVLEDIMNRRIVQALDEAGYEGRPPEAFTSKPWRERLSAPTEDKQRMGLRRKGSHQQTDAERLRAENERLKQQLAERAVGSAPGATDAAAGNKGNGRKPAAGERSDLINLEEADNLNDIRESLRALR